MPAPTATTRVVVRRVAALALLAGLFAMHGLAMPQPAAMSSAAMRGHATTGHSTAEHPTAEHPTAGRAPTGYAAVPAGPSLTATDAGCTSTDHCTATLRAADQLAAAPTATPVVGGAVEPVAAAAGAPGGTSPRAPPDLCALGISRT